MKRVLILIVISSFAFGMVGCKSSDDSGDTAAATTGATTGTDAGTPPPVANPSKTGAPAPSKGTVGLSANANDPRWKPGSMIKGNGK